VRLEPKECRGLREHLDLRVLLGRRELPARRARKVLRDQLDHKEFRALLDLQDQPA
jgi:hypothetical protein